MDKVNISDYEVDDTYKQISIGSSYRIHSKGYNEAENKPYHLNTLKKRKEGYDEDLIRVQKEVDNLTLSLKNYFNYKCDSSDLNDIIDIIDNIIEDIKGGDGDDINLSELESDIKDVIGDVNKPTINLLHKAFDKASLWYKMNIQRKALEQNIKDVKDNNYPSRIIFNE